uniref:SsgA family sporulation/cell division regulator n=1 Tax=Streptomyces sp. NP10 TaxID=1141731 RepID=UPI0023AE7F71|nr:SsgA family sporulation/cell division regulator [Streptomyces sp. NP10]
MVGWFFSRELLTAGTRRPAGSGDVRIWPARGRARTPTVCIVLGVRRGRSADGGSSGSNSGLPARIPKARSAGRRAQARQLRCPAGTRSAASRLSVKRSLATREVRSSFDRCAPPGRRLFLSAEPGARGQLGVLRSVGSRRHAPCLLAS